MLIPEGYDKVKIKRGDTISAICINIFPNLSITQQREKWHSFYRLKIGKLVKVDNINKIYTDEVLYYQVKKSNILTTFDGVINYHKAKPAQGSQLELLNHDIKKAKKLIKRAKDAIESPNKEKSLRKILEQEFGATSVLSENSKNIMLNNYNKMYKDADNIKFYVQKETPKTAEGKIAVAFAFNFDIAVWENKYFIEWKNNEPKRIETLLHELAHVAFNAGHKFEGDVISSGIRSADSYEVIASSLK